MNNNGAVGVAALWILVGASALGLAVISVAQAQKKGADDRLNEAHTVGLVVAGALLEREKGFAQESARYQFDYGVIRTTRFFDADHQRARLVCSAESKGLKKTVEVGWKRENSRWRVDYWNE